MLSVSALGIRRRNFVLNSDSSVLSFGSRFNAEAILDHLIVVIVEGDCYGSSMFKKTFDCLGESAAKPSVGTGTVCGRQGFIGDI